jgi:hypothetical protein
MRSRFGIVVGVVGVVEVVEVEHNFDKPVVDAELEGPAGNYPVDIAVALLLKV